MKNKKGFTLVEVLVTTFMFVVIVGAVSHLFANAIEAKKNVSAVQGDYEKAQLTLNLVAKVLRTSTVVGVNESIGPVVNNSIVSSVQVFDYSQVSAGSPCLSLKFEGDKLKMAIDDVGVTAIEDCDGTNNTPTFSSYRDLADNRIEGFFNVTETDITSNTTGKVTISLKAKPNTGNDRDVAEIQTTVSLRDYEN
jgi:prepilin-type N-terminal cleavage/methylation domain-containing protein